MRGFPKQHPNGVRTYLGDDGTWQVADGGGWIDGYYDAEETALSAVPYAGSAALSELSARTCHFDKGNRAITAGDLATISAQPVA